MPMSFKTHRMMISVTFKRRKLAAPIDDPFAHCRPFQSFICLSHVFYVTMTNPVLGQAIVSIGIRNLAQLGRIGGIPIQHEVLRRNSGKSFQCFSPGCSVAGKFIFYNENQTRSTYFLGCVLPFFVYRLTMRRLVLQAPEVEAAGGVSRGFF